MIYKHETTCEITIIKEEMPLKAKEHGFGVLKEYSFKELLEEKGFSIEKDITVFELCNPSGAQAALSSHPEISVFLPCRISLYEDKGKTVISTIGMEDIIDNFDIDDVLKNRMAELFNKIKALIDTWE